jgi:hypothetical protein
MNKEWKINFDHKEHLGAFFMLAFSSVVFGLLLGGVIDTSFRKVQNDESEKTYGRSVAYFALQASVNILVLMTLTKSTIYFLPWLQLSVSGALFAVLLFTSQRNLVDNANRITDF